MVSTFASGPDIPALRRFEMEQMAPRPRDVAGIILDESLLTTTFETDSSAVMVEQNLKTTITKFLKAEPVVDFKLLLRQDTANTLRAILLQWQQLLDLDVELGDDAPVNSLYYGYAAVSAIKGKKDDNSSLEHQVVDCLTGEFKQYSEIAVSFVEDVFDAASKVYLELMQQIEATQQETGDAAAEFKSTTQDKASESSEGFQAPIPQQRGTKRKGAFEDDVDENVEMSGEQEPKASPNKRKKLPQKNKVQTTIEPMFADSATGKSTTDSPSKAPGKTGNFGHGKAIKWYKDEQYWVQQRIRENPSMPWAKLTADLNARFEETPKLNDKKETIWRGVRTTQAVQQRFVEFRKRIQQRLKDGQPIQGTESDVEPPESDVEWESGSRQSMQGTETKGERAERRADTQNILGHESPESDADPAGDLDEVARRVEDGEQM